MSVYRTIAPLVIFKFLIKSFVCLGVMNMWMDLVDSMPVATCRYWSEVLCFAIPTHVSDLEVKVMDFKLSFNSFSTI